MKIYNLGDMRRRVSRAFAEGRSATENCACHEPKLARSRAREIAGGIGSRRRTVADHAPQRPPEGVEPVILTAGRGSKCMPYLKVEKDAEKFAACNALAEKIGPLNTPKKAYEIIEDAIIDEVNEVFGVITLDLHLRLKSIAETGRGNHRGHHS